MQHSRQQLESDLAQQERALRQTTDARRAKIFQNTIRTIKRLLEQAPPTSDVYSNPPPEHSGSQPPPPPRATAKSVNMPHHPPRTTARQRAEANAPRTQTLTVSAVNVGGTPTVTIEWDINGSTEAATLTEGECRGRFTTALRDLLESKRWEQGRLEDVQRTITFMRAQGYFSALCKFWQRPPTMSELDLNHSRFSEIFQIVTNTTP